MDIRASVQRVILEKAWSDAKLGNPDITVVQALTAYRDAKYEDGAGAGLGMLIGVTDKGHTVNFAPDSSRGTQPSEYLALAQIAIEKARAIVTAYPAYTQEQVFSALLLKFISRRSIQSDFRSMNIA